MSEQAFDPNKRHAGRKMSDEEFAQFRGGKHAEQEAARKKQQETLPPKQARSAERPNVTDAENPYRSMAEDMGNNNPEGRQTPATMESAELEKSRHQQSAKVRGMIVNQEQSPDSEEAPTEKRSPAPAKKSWLKRLFGGQ